ncbi:chitobiase/beta-hexosaminidase C-terminal domain-containing protein [Cohnella sp. 56]|uniref:chitobiase/beta-hexosaminidase C-terminal domain-containing protein n=1 Tax=Cohnella sp. 56 TaxID=3113722 RepID=UPI0030E7C7D3
MRMLSTLLIAIALFASAIMPAGAVTTSDYSEQVAYTDASHAKITFVSLVSSTYVYVHYKVNNGQDLNYLMGQSGNTWTYDVGGLSAGDVITYWYTYQKGTTQYDTPQWGYSYTHTAQTGTVATPTFSPAGGTYSAAQTVTIASATSGATIYYTTNGATPTTSSSVYSGPITVSASLTLKAMAVKSGLTNSAVATAAYTIGTPSTGLAKFEPADGKTIIAIGQDKNEMDAYQALTDIPDQAGYMIYTSTMDAGGMTGPVDKGAGINDFAYWAANKTNSVAQLGIDMVDYDGNPVGQQEVDKVASGQRDTNLITIATAVKNAGKPVFVRIGYEADSPWNKYEAASYIKAFKHVHDIFRQQGVGNAAFVWSLVGYGNAGGPAPYYSPVPIESWYPGDDYVDWVSISWFGWQTSADETTAAQSRQDAVSFAANHHKPLMIAEATPRTYNNMLLTNSSTWNNYFQKIFDFIAANNVKMFCYINQNWGVQPIFSDPMWGDSRIQQSGAGYIYDKWKTEVTKSRYLNSSSGLYAAIGFNPTAPAAPVVTRPTYSLPGRVQAEQWSDAKSVYNTPLPGTGNNMALCWLSSNSTMSYKTNVTAAGSYRFKLRIANGSGTSTTATVKVDGTTVATISIPTTADWDTYADAVSAAVNLTSGAHTITFQPGGTFNFDWFEVNP